MKIERIVLQEFRRFHAPLVLEGLSDGINLFVGENEAGKSTVVAALRAAFLERVRTRTVVDFAPWGSSGARPSVVVDFRIGDARYSLRKHFLTKSRCELLIDGGRERLEGEAAEDALAALLGFTFAQKGQAQPKQAGVPGLLWIQQGEAQELAEPAAHAGTHLRDALMRLSGEVTTSDGDRLFDKVSALRAELFEARAARPKGIYRETEAALAAAQLRVQTLEAEKAQLDADVDRLAQLREQHAAAEREQPWKRFEEDAAAARTRLADIARARDAFEVLQRERTTAEAMRAALQSQVVRDTEEAEAIAAHKREGLMLAAAAQDAQAASEEAQANLTRLQDTARQARARHAQAQAAAERRDLQEQALHWAREADRLTQALEQAAVLRQRIDMLAERIAAQRLTRADLDALRVAERVLAEARIRQDAAATRLSYRLDAGRTLRLGDTTLTGEGERLLTGAVTLDVPGIGELRIAPGGNDLPELLRDIDAQTRARDALLRRAGVASLIEAEANWAMYLHQQQERDAASKELLIRAPQGVDGLREVLDAGRRLQAARDARYATLAEDMPDAAVETPPWTIEAAARARELAEADAVRAADALRQAVSRFDSCAARARLLSEQAQSLADAYDAPQRQLARAERAARLVEQARQVEALVRRSDTAAAELAAQRSELIEQDRQRYERSAQIARDAHQARHHAMLTLTGALEQAGARGLGEDLLQAQADVERLSRRRDEIALRASALDMLATLLQQKRDAATLRLQLPLARRLNHYLPLLFPGAQLRLGDDLMPVDLQRAEQQDALATLSFGTREQLGLLVRLAYADLLRESGRPTLLILDDALVHADSARRTLMKRALFDAASRHQILMFTCHGEAWQDLGAAPRELR